MDHHCFSDLTRSLRSSRFASGKMERLRQHAQGPYSGKQAKELVAMFNHSSAKVEALKSIQQGLLPMRSGEAASVMISASFEKHKIAMLEILIRYIVNLDSPTAETDITSTLSFGRNKEKARKIIMDAKASTQFYPSPAGSAYPGSSYPGNPPAGSAYPGSGCPGNQPAGSAYPGSSYPGNQPAGSAYPGSGYPGNQPTGSAFPGSGYPGTQHAGSAYPGPAYPSNPAGWLCPSAPPMSPSNPGYPAGSAYTPAGSAGYPAGMDGYPGARPAGAAFPGYPQ